MVLSLHAPAVADDTADSPTPLVPQTYTGPTPPPINTTLGNELPVTGYYVESVDVGGIPRTSKVYIPEGMYIRGYFTIVSIPDGWDTEEFLTESGWIDIANERAEGLFILEPDQSTGQWADVTTESAYITAALEVMGSNRFYSTFGVHYIAGYGTGGTALQAWTANNPLFVIGAAFVDTADLSDLDQIGAQQFTFSPKHSDTGLDPRFTSVPYRDVPVPVWFVNEDAAEVSHLVDYWKQANDVLPDPEVGEFGEVYQQDPDSDRLPTSYSEPVSRVAVAEQDVAVDDRRLTERISDFLTFYTRYDNTTVFGNMLGTRPDYDELGVDVKNMTVTEPDGQIWKRQYLVYEPKGTARAEAETPVVFAFAGGSQPCTLFFDITRWWEIADAYGFTVVVPCSQYSGPPYTPLELRWNYTNANLDQKADDFEFVAQLVAEIDRDYDVDPGRRFAFGHSNGSMFDHGIAYRMPEYFTAIAGNGASSMPISDSATSTMPMFLNMAENDNGNPYLSAPGNLRDLVSYWLDRNDVGEVDAPSSTQTGVGLLERTTLQRWENDQGIPLYMYGITAARDHNVSVDTAWTAWEEWFSKWSKDDAGRLFYDGEQVETEPVDDAPEVTVTPRTLGSKAYISVAARNQADVPVSITVESAYGSKSFENVAPGASVAVSINTRVMPLPAGEVTVTAIGQRDGVPFTQTTTSTYPAYGR